MKMQSDVRVTVRVDKDLKESADYLFERLGLNMSVAFNMFLRKAVNEDAIPFPVSINSAGFGHELSAGYITSSFNAAVANEVHANQQKGLPIARFDADKNQAYLESADGSREYIHG
ncbi:MAG: type II toxin-antitoxin system RelB/DinJ family antitoxin [Clostridiales bacterium]|nr:type II toxin-antitoxin system RelB/DinJ family antitoxin [Clostridiales bacterium]